MILPKSPHQGTGTYEWLRSLGSMATRATPRPRIVPHILWSLSCKTQSTSQVPEPLCQAAIIPSIEATIRLCCSLSSVSLGLSYFPSDCPTARREPFTCLPNVHGPGLRLRAQIAILEQRASLQTTDYRRHSSLQLPVIRLAKSSPHHRLAQSSIRHSAFDATLYILPEPKRHPYAFTLSQPAKPVLPVTVPATAATTGSKPTSHFSSANTRNTPATNTSFAAARADKRRNSARRCERPFGIDALPQRSESCGRGGQTSTAGDTDERYERGGAIGLPLTQKHEDTHGQKLPNPHILEHSRTELPDRLWKRGIVAISSALVTTLVLH